MTCNRNSVLLLIDSGLPAGQKLERAEGWGLRCMEILWHLNAQPIMLVSAEFYVNGKLGQTKYLETNCCYFYLVDMFCKWFASCFIQVTA